MPEQHKPPRSYQVQTLAAAHEAGQVVTISCEHCWDSRHYVPGDLLLIFGDMSVIEVTRKMRCEKCRRRSLSVTKLTIPLAEERNRMVVRHLVKIVLKQVPVWEERRG